MSQQAEQLPAQPPIPTEKSPQQLLEQQKQREQQQKLREQQHKKQEEQARIKKQQDIKKLQQALKGSLTNLSKISDNTTMTYVRMTLAQKQLQRIFPNILRYNQILHLDINTNAISDISILCDFPHLLTLNLSKNQISDLKAFHIEDKLNKLQFLNLSGNKIKQLTQIGLPALRKLNLCENQISNIKDWKGHQTLNILQLRKNKLRKLRGLINMKHLTQLYVCENQITDIRGLQNCNALVKLSVRNNKIKSIMSPFPYLPSLAHLNMRQNQLTSTKQLAKIDQHIGSINILANPVTDELGQNLKKQIIWILPHFTRINKSPVTEEERILFEKERLEKLALQEKQRLEKEQQARKAAEQEQQQPPPQ